MAIFVVYWNQELGELQDYPVDPWLLTEFGSRAQAIEHLRVEGYIKWKDGDLYFTSFHHVKTFAKILESRKAEEPRKSKYPPGTITH